MSDTGQPTRATPPDNGAATLRDRVRSLRLDDRPAPKGPARSGVLPWAMCAILLAMTAAFGYRAYRAGPAVPSGSAEEAGKGTSGGTAAPSASMAASGDVVLPAKGYVVAVHPVQVSPKVGGMLVWVDPNLEEGRIFKEGQKLAQIEDVDYKADRDQAKYTLEAYRNRWEEKKADVAIWKEQLEQARADREAAEARRQKADVTLARMMRAGSSVSLIDKDVASAELRAAKGDLASARARLMQKTLEKKSVQDRLAAAWGDVRQAEATLAKAQWRLDNTVIRAPVTGTILSKRAERGNIVNPGAFSTGAAGGISASLCDIADLRDIEIDLSIQERDIANVQEKQTCLVMPDAYQKHKPFLARHPQGYVGYVSRLMPTADRAKGAVPVRVRIPREAIPPEEAGVYLRPDTGVMVLFKRVEDRGKKLAVRTPGR
jgi:multidrug resistance efflux pump